jgi:prolyl-tRNA synthetase
MKVQKLWVDNNIVDIDDDEEEEEDEDEDCDRGECVDDEETEDEEVEDEIVHVTSQKKLLKFVAIHGETPTSILRLTSDDLDAVSPQKLTAMLRNSGYVLPVGKVKVLRTNDIVLVVNKDNNNKIYYKTTQDV